MENQIPVENKTTLKTNVATEADNIISAVREDGFEKILKFRKGEYFIGDDQIPLGAEYLAHAAAWTKTWIKFVDGKVADRKLYRVARGEKPPEREELDDLDQSTWRRGGLDGGPSDPWVYQYLLPLEDMSSGEIVIFATPSVGGQKAVRELCDRYAKRIRKGEHGQPIIKLATVEMPSKKYGKVPAPAFKITGWDDAAASTTSEELAAAIPVQHTAKAAVDMDDEIPF